MPRSLKKGPHVDHHLMKKYSKQLRKITKDQFKLGLVDQ